MIWQGSSFPFPKTTSVNRRPKIFRRKPSTRWRQAMVSFADLEGKGRAKPSRPRATKAKGKPGRREEQHVCHGPQQMTAGAGQIASLLFARCADVHVDFHAHLHFDDLRSFPGHLGLPSHLAQHLRRPKRKAAMRFTQEPV